MTRKTLSLRERDTYVSYLVLDEKIAEEFHSRAFFLKEYPCDYGKMRQLRIRLQHLCGLTELEALNVLTNHNVDDYICKYSGGVRECRLECRETDVNIDERKGDEGYERLL